MLLERAIALAPRSAATLDALPEDRRRGQRLGAARRRARAQDRRRRARPRRADRFCSSSSARSTTASSSAPTARATRTSARCASTPTSGPPCCGSRATPGVRGDGPAATDALRKGRGPRGLARRARQAPVRPTTSPRRTFVSACSRTAPGNDGTAEREANRALAALSDHAGALDLLAELLEAQARHGELADVLGRRAGTGLGQAARVEMGHKRAIALERRGAPRRGGRRVAARSSSSTPRRSRRCDVSPTPRAPPTTRPRCSPCWSRLGDALASTGDASGAEQIIAARLQLVTDPLAKGALATERAAFACCSPTAPRPRGSHSAPCPPRRCPTRASAARGSRRAARRFSPTRSPRSTCCSRACTRPATRRPPASSRFVSPPCAGASACWRPRASRSSSTASPSIRPTRTRPRRSPTSTRRWPIPTSAPTAPRRALAPRAPECRPTGARRSTPRSARAPRRRGDSRERRAGLLARGND